MSKFDKLINKIFSTSSVSYEDAENILLSLGFELKVRGSHHNFRKKNYLTTVTIKKIKELLPYQIKLLRQVLIDHDYKKNK